MIRLTAVLPLALATAATASATSTDALNPTVPWWEKVTVTIDGDGKPQSCRFESSLNPATGQACEVDGSQASLARRSSGGDEYTKITFERRFNPGAQPKTGLAPGETLLGGQMMSLAIDSRGSVKGCRVVASSGSMRPEYGCEELASEKFQASTALPRQPEKQAYMTVLVYGHQEHMV